MLETAIESKEQELNRKLAKWAGFENDGGRAWWAPGVKHHPVLQYYENYRYLPNFAQSLDACFKWLVPKAIDKIMAEQGCSSDVAYAILFTKWLQELELIIPKAALALCLAISKLIEKDIDK